MPKTRFLLFLFATLASAACHHVVSDTAEEAEPEIITPVTVTQISTEPMVEYIELNATSAFLNKAYLKASANGYIRSVNAQLNKRIGAGQVAFTLVTKEARSIGNTINLLDTSFRFSGIIQIRAGTSGYVSELTHQAGDYVQEGEQLAVISDINSFVFILNLPYELRPYVLNREDVELLLPDGQKLAARISSTTPLVDSASQTQNVILSVKDKSLPINLIARVRVVKTARTNTVSLPKQAVLADETQTGFWVMKVKDDSTAIKVPVTKGIETNDRIEILTPAFNFNDRFLLTGNFGLSDTARIRIQGPSNSDRE